MAVSYIIIFLYEAAIILFVAGVFLDLIGLDIIGLLNPRIEEKKLWWLMYTFSIIRLIGVAVASCTTIILSFAKMLEGLGTIIEKNMEEGLFVFLASFLWLFIAVGITGTVVSAIRDYSEERKKWE